MWPGRCAAAVPGPSLPLKCSQAPHSLVLFFKQALHTRPAGGLPFTPGRPEGGRAAQPGSPWILSASQV